MSANRWGVMKLGLAVAVIGLFGVWKFSQGSAAPMGRGPGVFSRAAAQISGAAIPAAVVGYDDGTAAAFGESLSIAQAPGAERAGAPMRKIVRTASAVFEVTDVNKARSLLRAAVFRNSGDIEEDQSFGAGESQGVVLVIKVPPERLDALLKDLEPLGRLLERSVSSSNRGEEYVDLKARLENARKVEKRLTEFLAVKTARLGDVLAVERELERVGRDIETTIGRMKYIDSLVATSRVTVRLQPPLREVSRTVGLFGSIRNSLVSAFNNFIAAGLALMRVTGFLLAVGLWTGAVTWVLWFVKRKVWG